MVFASWGSAWGTWRAGLGLCHMGIDHPAGIIKCIVPIVMAGVLGIYGLIVSVIITQSISPPIGGINAYSTYNSYTHVSSTLSIFSVYLRKRRDFRTIRLSSHILSSILFFTWCFGLNLSVCISILIMVVGGWFVLWIILFGSGWYHWNIG